MPISKIVQNSVDTGVAGSGPAFSAYNSTPTSCSNTVTTKILLQTETFDTNNNFASSTFTPTVAGYYQINAGCCFSFTVNNAGIYIFIFKNGTSIAGASTVSTSSTYPAACTSTVVYMNGTTDYIELYGQQKSGSTQSTAQFNTLDATYMSGCLIKAA
jgi:hypothetical protein